ncbi:MAG: GntR family transcriptional regulator [Thermomicrobiales bacterium]
MASTVATTKPATRIGDTLHGLCARAGGEEFPNLANALYDLMWKRLVNLEFPPGARLSDDALARELGVSRTPMREALYRLSQVGLVRVNARRGFFVATLSRRDVDELYDLRTALEVFAITRAAPLLTNEDLAIHRERQRVARRRVHSLSPADVEDFVTSDLLLHDMLVRCTGNERLQQALADVKGQLSIAHLRLAQTPEHNLCAIEEHEHILDAIAARDPDAAAAAMEAHLHGVKVRVLEEFFPEPG